MCFWRSLLRGRALKRATGGHGQCPAAPEDMVQPDLCVAKGQVQDQSGWGHGQSVKILLTTSGFLLCLSRSPHCPPSTLWEEGLVRWREGRWDFSGAQWRTM